MADTGKHYELDGCCGYCGPCFRSEHDPQARRCEGWPCPAVVTPSQADRQPPASSSETKGGQGPAGPDA